LGAASGNIGQSPAMGREQAIVKLGEVFRRVAANDIGQFEHSCSD
jgi:hypothetical protein